MTFIFILLTLFAFIPSPLLAQASLGVLSEEDRYFYADYLNLQQDRTSLFDLKTKTVDRSNGDAEQEHQAAAQLWLQPKLFLHIALLDWHYLGKNENREFINARSGIRKELESSGEFKFYLEHQSTRTGFETGFSDVLGLMEYQVNLSSQRPWNDTLLSRELRGWYDQMQLQGQMPLLAGMNLSLRLNSTGYNLEDVSSFHTSEQKMSLTLGKNWAFTHNSLRLSYTLDRHVVQRSMLPVEVPELHNHTLRTGIEHQWGTFDWWGYQLWSVIEVAHTQKVVQERGSQSFYFETLYKRSLYQQYWISFYSAESSEIIGKTVEKHLQLGGRWNF